jgi:hypothetical protein
MLTLALIGRRSLNYGKEGGTQWASGPAKSDPRLLPHSKGEWNLTSWLIHLFQIQYKEKILKMDHDNLRKVLHWQAS